MKLNGYPATIFDKDQARKRELREYIELSAAQVTGNNSDQMVGNLVDRMATVLLELEQRGIDVSRYLD